MGTFVVYIDHGGEFRWYLLDEENHRIADSVQGFNARQDCEHEILLMKRLTPLARTVKLARVETLV